MKVYVFHSFFDFNTTYLNLGDTPHTSGWIEENEFVYSLSDPTGIKVNWYYL